MFYTGAAPNQQAIPAVDYLMKDVGVKRWVLAGTDYVYPRTTNKILEAYLKAKGVTPADIMINYTPFGHSDWQTHRRRTSRSSARPARRPPWCRPSTATPTCRSTRSSATRRSRPRTFRSWPSRSVRKSCRASTPSRSSATWPPGTTSRAIKNPANDDFIKQWKTYIKNPKRVDQRPDGSARHRLQHVGEGRREGQDHRRRAR